jgi:hypothetical protein
VRGGALGTTGVYSDTARRRRPAAVVVGVVFLPRIRFGFSRHRI